MFGLFKKKQPLTVKEIEEAVYEGYLSFNTLKPFEFSTLIMSHKFISHPKMCPKSLLLDTEKLDVSEVYGFIWMYIVQHLLDNGLKVNMNLFQRGEYFGDLLDGLVCDARQGFMARRELKKYWVGD